MGLVRYLPVVIELALLVYCLIDCIQSDEGSVRNLPKTMWVLLIIFLPIVGSVAWLAVGRPQGAPARSVPWPSTRTAGSPSTSVRGRRWRLTTTRSSWPALLPPTPVTSGCWRTGRRSSASTRSGWPGPPRSPELRLPVRQHPLVTGVGGSKAGQELRVVVRRHRRPRTLVLGDPAVRVDGHGTERAGAP